MSLFRLKQFSVRQQQAALKIGTDSTLLGAYVSQLPLEGIRSILDVGTGTGIVALMVAQNCPNTMIDAIEIDPSSAEEADHNFRSSPWKDRLAVICDNFILHPFQNQYQLIISNPPYFTDTHTTECNRSTTAKHMQSLPPELFFQKCDQLLHHEPQSAIITITATSAIERFIHSAKNASFHPYHHLYIHPVKGKEPKRVITIWKRSDQEPTIEHLDILIGPGRHDYSPECTELLRPYLTIFPTP